VLVVIHEEHVIDVLGDLAQIPIGIPCGHCQCERNPGGFEAGISPR